MSWLAHVVHFADNEQDGFFRPLLTPSRAPAESLYNSVVPQVNPMSHTEERRSAESREQLRLRIRQEFGEMAGLSLTIPQATRVFGQDRHLCERVLNELVSQGFLRKTGDSYERSGG